MFGLKAGLFAFGDTIPMGLLLLNFGHTPGHCGFLISSNGQQLLIAGDFLRIAPVQFPHPEYSLVYDGDIDAVVAKRKLVLGRC